MYSPLHALCSKIMEATWLTAPIVVALFFNFHTARGFEPDKITLLRSLALLGAVVLAVKKIEEIRLRKLGSGGGPGEPQLPLWRRPFVVPLFMIGFVYLAGTLLSVAPRTSWWGSYQRLGGAYTMFSYIVLCLILLDGLRSWDQWLRLRYALLVSSLPVALYGVLQRFGADPLSWVEMHFEERVGANMSNPIFFAAYLIMLVPLVLETILACLRRLKLGEAGFGLRISFVGVLSLILLAQLSGIAFANSRGPYLGLAVGIFFYVLLYLVAHGRQASQGTRLRIGEILVAAGVGIGGLIWTVVGFTAMVRFKGVTGVFSFALALLGVALMYAIGLFAKRRWRWLWLSWLTQALAAVLVVVFLFQSREGYLDKLSQLPYVGRFANTQDLESGSGMVRITLWRAALDIIRPHPPLIDISGREDGFNALRPLIGHGPETMQIIFRRFYIPELARVEGRGSAPSRSHNENLDNLITTGALGLVAHLFLFGTVLYQGLVWIGMARGRKDRNLYISLSAGFSIVGFLVPLLIGSPHYAGVGVGFGLIAGVIAYASCAAFVRSDAAEPLDDRRFLIAALMAAVVAHFIELQFGIGVAATRMNFFIFIAALAALGTSQLTIPAKETNEEGLAGPVRAQNPRKGKRSRNPRPDPAILSGLRSILPYGLLTAVLLLVLNWDFIANPSGLKSDSSIFWHSWTSFSDGRTQAEGVVPSVWIVILVAIASLVWAIAETRNWFRSRAARLLAAFCFLGSAYVIWVTHGLYQARFLLPMAGDIPRAVMAERLAEPILGFYLCLGLLLVALAASLRFPRPPSHQSWSRQPAILAGIGVLVLVIAYSFIGSNNITQIQADSFARLGISAGSASDWQQAVAWMERAVARAPTEDHYQYHLGRALIQDARSRADDRARRETYDRAEAVWLRALELAPMDVNRILNVAGYYLLRGEDESDDRTRSEFFRKAIVYYEKASAFSPKEEFIYNLWARVHSKLGEFGAAEKLIQRSLGLNPSLIDTFLEFGDLETSRGNLEAALLAYDRASSLNPRDIRVHSGRAFVYYRLGRLRDAIVSNLEVIAIDRDHTDSLRNLALLYEKTGDNAQALVFAERARASVPQQLQSSFDELITNLKQRQNGVESRR